MDLDGVVGKRHGSVNPDRRSSCWQLRDGQFRCATVNPDPVNRTVNREPDGQFTEPQFDAERRPFLGRRKVLEQSRYSRPKTREPRFGISPKVACRNKWRRIERLQANKRWLATGRRWRSGAAAITTPCFRPGRSKCASSTALPAPSCRVESVTFALALGVACLAGHRCICGQILAR